jgi:hypothetical protein
LSTGGPPSAGGGGDLARDLTQRVVMSALAISRDPDVRTWLERRRSRLAPPCAFLAGCAIAGAIWWQWHGFGLMALGCFAAIPLGPIVAAWPAGRLARNRRPDVPRFHGSTAAIPVYAFAGATSVVLAAGCVPAVWRESGDLILLGPAVAVIFAVLLAPMFLSFEWETRRELRQGTTPGPTGAPDPQ